ncbi:MAG: CotH kinase family protein [Fibromonadales bacterium]|nr:CotH kinase family protein [Fibromonadales bacterium]
MSKLFLFLLAFFSLLIGVQALISCSESTPNADDIGIPLPPLSSCFASSSSSYGSNNSNGSSSNSDNNSSSGSDISSSSVSSSSGLPLTAIELPKSGYYQSGVPTITIPMQTEQGTVYCDSTGAAPRENGSIGPGSTLNFSTKNAVLQCASFKDGKAASKTIMRTYIIERLPDLPIVSIAVDPYEMFKAPQALYKSSFTPGMNCGGASSPYRRDDSLLIHVDFFEKDFHRKGEDVAWSYPAAIKIHGGCSRQWPKKSVIVSFKESYGQKNLKYPLFPDFPELIKFKHFMLRNNGNNYDSDYIRDMLMSSLTEGLGLEYQKGRAVVVFYNGEYYGIHNLRERANSDYFETNYNIDEEFIDLVKVDNGGTVSKGSDDDYQSNVYNWLNGVSLADDNNFKTLEQRIDVDNFTNHFQSRIYYKDCDWPGKNMKRWRSRLGQSKWRWLLYDTDHGFGSWGGSVSGCGTMEYITATNGPDWPNPPHSTLIMRKLLGNQNYKYMFINRFSLLIATYFAPERVNARISELMAPINNETSYDQQKWGSKSDNGRTPIAAFATSRPADMQSNIKNFFNLDNPVSFTLSINGNGRILVHNLPLPKNSVTFNAYPDIPITIKAVGTGFKGWSDGVPDAERTLTITTATTLTANF